MKLFKDQVGLLVAIDPSAVKAVTEMHIKNKDPRDMTVEQFSKVPETLHSVIYIEDSHDGAGIIVQGGVMATLETLSRLPI